jgi:LAO/AO transport system kinase
MCKIHESQRMNPYDERPVDADSPSLAHRSSRSSRGATRRAELTLDQYEAGIRAGDVGVLARALTLTESSSSRHTELADRLLTRLLRQSNRALRVGITGGPGVGKSTFIESLGMLLVGRGQRIAVLAVDPSSVISGGSILGDKTRMTHLSAQPRAYIRPSPSAGTLGGVARKTRESVLVCEAAGYDVVLIETIGVGQSETMVADMTDCFVAVVAPGGGDELQGIKRGLLERVDILVVNKADGALLPAAELAAGQYSFALHWLAGHDDHPEPEVLTCSALENQGIDAVWTAVEQRHAHRQASGELAERQRQQNLKWLWSTVHDRLRHTVDTHPAVQAIREDLERQVAAGTILPDLAARQILEVLGLPSNPS